MESPVAEMDNEGRLRVVRGAGELRVPGPVVTVTVSLGGVTVGVAACVVVALPVGEVVGLVVPEAVDVPALLVLLVLVLPVENKIRQKST